MNNKTPMAVFCGVFIICACGICVAESPPPKPLTVKPFQQTRAMKEIADQVGKLAASDIPASVVFAKELVKVLNAHKVKMPEKLAKLKAPKPPLPDYEEMTESIFKPTHKIDELCAKSIWTKYPDYALPASLRNELLAAIACHCPNGANRFDSARQLYDRINDNPEEYPDVPFRLVHKATVSAINYILDRASKGKFSGDNSAVVLYGIALSANHIALESMIAEKPSNQALDKIVAEYKAKTDALLKAAKDEKLIIALTRAKQNFKKFDRMTDMWAQLAVIKKGLEPVIKGFIDAVNKEDKKAASKYMTEEMAEGLLKQVSLREAISQTKDQKVKEVKFLLLGNPDGGGVKDGKLTIGSIQVHLNIIYYKGQPKQIKRDLPVVLTPNGWLIGNPKKKV
ncbi:MAG: hypothetical protein FVQ82_01255 [Planctomycetes bacterium]|nr:hypothetical protein [Planctomycetota bacterium]